MLDPLFRKLRNFSALSSRDRLLVEQRAWRVDRFASHVDLVQEGSDPRFVNVVLDGWACRYKQLEDGRRQILALFVPGDMCDPCVFLLDKMSHTLATLTPATVGRLPEAEMLGLLEESPTLSRAFWLDMLINAEVQREWTVSLGRRTAIERTAHLFCELLVRQRAIGASNTTGECDLLMTQSEIGDALGLSSVHVNRTLQELRGMKLIELKGKRLVVYDEAALRTLALFDPNYLHLQRSIS